MSLKDFGNSVLTGRLIDEATRKIEKDFPLPEFKSPSGVEISQSQNDRYSQLIEKRERATIVADQRIAIIALAEKLLLAAIMEPESIIENEAKTLADKALDLAAEFVNQSYDLVLGKNQ